MTSSLPAARHHWRASICSSLFLLSLAAMPLMAWSTDTVIELPLSGAAYRIADQAYRAYAQGDYASAIRAAREAIRLRPDVTRLQELLRQASAADKAARTPRRNGSPVTAPASATSSGQPATQQTDSASQQLAIDAAARALAANQHDDLPLAVREARTAIRHAPLVPQYRLMLIDLLIRLPDENAASAEAATAVSMADDDVMPQVLLAWLQQRHGQREAARDNYASALQSDALGDDDLRNLRLLAADAALSAGDGDAVQTALAALPATDQAAAQRRLLAQMIAAGSTAFRPELTAPIVRCVINRFGPVCSLFAGEEPARLLARAAYQAMADNRSSDAVRLIDTALQVGGNDAELNRQRDSMRRMLAREPAATAYQALADNDPVRAEQAADSAIAYAPDVMAYRLLLIDARQRQQHYAAAEQAAAAAVEVDDEDAVPLLLRGYFRQMQRNYAAAKSDYLAALNNDTLSDDDLRELRLWVSDAAHAAGDLTLASEQLALLPASSDEVIWRQLQLDLDRRYHDGKIGRPRLQAPFLDCRQTPYGTVCTARPPDNANQTLAESTWRLIGKKQYGAAVTLAQRLTAMQPDNDNYRRLLAQALDSDRQPQAAQAVRAGLQHDAPPLESAYLALLADAPQAATQTFRELDAAGKIPPRALQDAGFAALNANQRPLAVSYFHRTIDAVDSGDLALAPQQVFDIRRAISELEREWGYYVALSYRGASTLSTPGAVVGDDSLQFGTEAYWRPPSLVRDGTYVDLYARVTGSAYSKSGNATSGPSLQAAAGARWKPLAQHNLIAAFERLIPIGNAAQSDWLARLGYSWGKGMDLRVDTDRWNSHQVFAETGYYLQAGTWYFTSEAQSGRSYRLPDNWSRNTVIWPHVVLGADYNTGFPQPLAIGAGIGVNLRRWLREDHYHAPRSYFDLSVQYRRKLAGDERAGGFFIRSIFNY